ncbi:1-(5-phosphoribosyl)-5-((5-phosphoribosylamino)methylideneamino)imidazole-4-carboxamide isomerase [Microbulbifer sp. A4B17]|uniref:1-(5-phosphoribosyl)-5-[(5- phosphoribosylamino)methylideneamino]imidazole-4- carboxamide isomerase n=1 Tax=Microbulbifer sp. A4B17 TaxID=359370 RepID=UPI000D52BFDC|nr:1-(5-phosphoribosyl)-5-[(5-phosphoribosylamino)methylideneamino]imidazole-4-carboxamide isomerase [Microbulbifer sp. A4B17]AWF83122.1 1-(5-phosphoribosyl)-5-((5-phosphoribosylamino)methylideneamino)imidazole-4-carboxamide isomerase [Microbulbifer sp. A4B17]
MIVIPAIDLKDGQCVRLRQGEMDDATIFSDDPLATAQHWVNEGAKRLHLVDLNGAFAGNPVNGEAVTAIAKQFPDLPVQIGGGIRDLHTVERYLDAGVQWGIIGTAAVKNPKLVEEACREFEGHIIVGLDAKDGLVATEGWAEVSELKATELAKRFADCGVSSIVYTDIARDGMMQGVNIEATLEMARAVQVPIIASGGVSSIEDIEQLLNAGEIYGAITGRAIYEDKLNLREAQQLCDQRNK